MKHTKRKEVTADVGDEPVHLATVDWQRGKWSSVPGKYSREHVWLLAGGLTLKATDPIAPAAYRDRARLDPVNAFVATIASGHLLAWLNVAFGHGVEPESYVDAPQGVLSHGELWVSEVILRPLATFKTGQNMTKAMLTHYHELAHLECFIARSVRTNVSLQIRVASA